MSYSATMFSKYPNINYYCQDTYESLVWNESEPKPTDKELQSNWEEIKQEYFKCIMIQEHNGLLMTSDFRALPDYSEWDKWLNYRQKNCEIYLKVGL